MQAARPPETDDDLRGVLDDARLGLRLLDPRGRILWANRAELDLVGCQERDYVGHHLREFFVEPGAVAEMLARLAGARPQPAAPRAVRGGELRGHLRQPDRERAVRPRARELHRSRPAAQGTLRAGPRGIREHSWPGDVRELKNVVERAYVLTDDEVDLEVASARESDPTSALHNGVGSSRGESERQLILATLDHFSGDKRKAAAMLKISLNTLYSRRREYKLD